MKDYWFFLSYARRDSKDDKHLKQFYEDLALEVGRVVGLSASVKETDIGFFDEEGIEAGAKWDDSLAEALQTSKVFICLYSRGYFSSENCGKEFYAFHSRLKAYVPAPNLQPPRLILPVLWAGPDRLPRELPSVVSKIQYKHADFGQLYATEGLNYIMRLQKTVEYEEFKIRFANKLVREAETHKLPRLDSRPSFENVPNAFDDAIWLSSQASPSEGAPAVAALPPQLPKNVGPEVAWFVYVAGQSKDYQEFRTNRQSYGLLGGREWRPYHPPIDKRLGVITQGVAAVENLLEETLHVDDRLIQHLQLAEETNTIVIIIMDPWSVRVDSYKKPLADLDRTRLMNCGVLIIWNEKDDETNKNSQSLKDEIEMIFFRSMGSTDIYFRDSIRSEEELRTELSAAINEIRLKLMKKAKLFRPVGGDKNSPLPTISGPGGGSL